MKNYTLATVFFLILLVFISSPEIRVEAQSGTIVVPDDYSSIFDDVGNASIGDTIYVKSGNYIEPTIVIYKSISLIGEDANSTIIQSSERYEWDLTGLPPPLPPTIQIKSDNVTVSNFTIDKPLYSSSGHISSKGNQTQITDIIIVKGNLYLDGSQQTIVKNTINATTQYGIKCSGSQNNITQNHVYGSAGGISIEGSNNQIGFNNVRTISDTLSSIISMGDLNVIFKNDASDGIGVFGSNNTVWANGLDAPVAFGMGGYGNTFYENNVVGIKIGTRIPEAYNNIFYRNNFFGNNPIEIVGVERLTFWDNGETGNYWIEYNGMDINEDGIGDTPFIIDENNQDNYPSLQPVDIETIPEFPSWTVLLFLLMGALVSIKLKKKLKKQFKQAIFSTRCTLVFEYTRRYKFIFFRE